MLGGLALERARKPPRASEERCGLGSGGCGGGSRFDPPDNVRPLQPALWLKGLADFPQDAMHDRATPMARKRAASDCGASSNLFAPATLLQNTAGQVSGFLSQADEQPGAAAVGQHGTHFGSLSRHPADGAVNQYVHHLPSATLLPHNVVQNIPLTGSRGDLGLYDPIAPGGPDEGATSKRWPE